MVGYRILLVSSVPPPSAKNTKFASVGIHIPKLLTGECGCATYNLKLGTCSCIV